MVALGCHLDEPATLCTTIVTPTKAPKFGSSCALDNFDPGSSASILRVKEFISLALVGPHHVEIQSLLQSNKFYIISATPTDFAELSPCRIGHMYWFHQLISEIRGTEPREIIICCGNDSLVLTLCALLVGSLLILVDGESSETVENRFRSILPFLLPFHDNWSEESILPADCWRALARARANGWVGFSSHSEEDADLDRRIDMREHLHYDCPANGGVHVLIPGRLLTFDCPADPGPQDPAGHAPRRATLSPAYYTEVLRDFGVQLVVSVGGGGAAGPTAGFLRAGMAAEAVDCGGAGMLRPLSLLQVLPPSGIQSCRPACRFVRRRPA